MKKVLFVALISMTFFACKKDSSKTLTNFKITSVIINSIPDATDPLGWDPGNGKPDVYFKIKDINNNLLYSYSNYFPNASSSSFPIYFELANAFQITNTSATFKLEIWDYDTPDPDDFAGSVSFSMDEYTDGHPTTFTRTSGNLSVTVNGSWY